jgi:hypothetical protein
MQPVSLSAASFARFERAIVSVAPNATKCTATAQASTNLKARLPFCECDVQFVPIRKPAIPGPTRNAETDQQFSENSDQFAENPCATL